jgi:hypothetical protein
MAEKAPRRDQIRRSAANGLPPSEEDLSSDQQIVMSFCAYVISPRGRLPGTSAGQSDGGRRRFTPTVRDCEFVLGQAATVNPFRGSRSGIANLFFVGR